MDTSTAHQRAILLSKFQDGDTVSMEGIPIAYGYLLNGAKETIHLRDGMLYTRGGRFFMCIARSKPGFNANFADEVYADGYFANPSEDNNIVKIWMLPAPSTF